MTITTPMLRGLKLHEPDATLDVYLKLLDKLATRLTSLTIENIEHNKAFARSYNRSVRNDDIIDDLELATKSIKMGVARQVLTIVKLLPDLFDEIRDFTRRAIKRSIVHIETSVSGNVELIGNSSVKLPKIATLRKSWATENARLIRSIPDELLSKVGRSVSEAVANGESIESLKKRILQLTDITKRRARVIARDQISKLRGVLARHESLSRGVLYYEWSTSGDEAVRTSHKEMNKKICSWVDVDIYKDSLNDSSWKKRSSIGGISLHPGQDILCRCTSFLVAKVEGRAAA